MPSLHGGSSTATYRWCSHLANHSKVIVVSATSSLWPCSVATLTNGLDFLHAISY